jgi:hypothetical protein
LEKRTGSCSWPSRTWCKKAVQSRAEEALDTE